MASRKTGVLKEQPAGTKSLEDDYEGQNHARALTDAAAVMRDPAKMKKALKHLSQQKKNIRSVDDLKAYHQQKYGPQGQAEHAETEGEEAMEE